MQQDKLQRRKQREERQLARLTAMKQKGRHAWYFVILVGVIILVDWLDNFTTNVNSKMANDFLTEFFVNGKGYTMSQANAVYESANLITYVIGLLTPFYKALADKWGRKPLFVISTAGMALGLLLIAVSRTFWGFMAGNVITYFFLSHDVQILYILEESPSDKRARIYSILKGIGALGAFFVPGCAGWQYPLSCFSLCAKRRYLSTTAPPTCYARLTNALPKSKPPNSKRKRTRKRQA